MTDAASTPGPDAGGDADRRSRPAPRGDNGAALSDEDVLALLDGLGVPGTRDREEDQDAIAAAEWEALSACDDDGSSTGGPGSGHGTAGIYGAGGLGLASGGPAGAPDWDLPGLAAGYRKLTGKQQAAAVAQDVRDMGRRAAAIEADLARPESAAAVVQAAAAEARKARHPGQ